MKPNPHSPSPLSSSPDVEYEYTKVMRTLSCAEIQAKLQQVCLTRSTSHPPATCRPECSPVGKYHGYHHRVDPPDPTELLRDVPSRTLRTLLFEFFAASHDASDACASLLDALRLARQHHSALLRLLRRHAAAASGAPDPSVLPALASHLQHSNPLSDLRRFDSTHRVYSSLSVRLALHAARLARRLRLLRRLRRASSAVLVASSAALTLALLVLLATHGAAAGAAAVAVAVAWAAPAGSWRPAGLGAMCRQADAAARGAYILSRDLDTVSRMVVRLRDGVERGREVAARCLRRAGDRRAAGEAAREMDGGAGGVEAQMDELEEHIYWCARTVGRTRGLVVGELGGNFAGTEKSACS